MVRSRACFRRSPISSTSATTTDRRGAGVALWRSHERSHTCVFVPLPCLKQVIVVSHCQNLRRRVDLCGYDLILYLWYYASAPHPPSLRLISSLLSILYIVTHPRRLLSCTAYTGMYTTAIRHRFRSLITPQSLTSQLQPSQHRSCVITLSISATFCAV